MGVQGNLSHWTPEAYDAPPVRAQTTGDLLDEAAQFWPDREYLVYSAYEDASLNVRWTFAEMRRRARMAGRAMMASGIEKGDRIAVWATNLPEWVVLQFGAAYAGAVVVPLNPLYRRDEAAYVLQWSVPGRCSSSPKTAARASGTSGSTRATTRAISRASWHSVTRPTTGATRGPRGSTRAATSPTRHCSIAAHKSRPATSCRSSSPRERQVSRKGAALRHVGLVNNARLIYHRAELRQSSTCSPLPFFHTGGCVIGMQGTMASGSSFKPIVTFDPRRMIDTIDNECVESIVVVPTMLFSLEEEFDARGGTLESLRTVVCGGSVVPPDVCERWHDRFGVDFSIIYGLTETSPVIVQGSPSDTPERQRTACGRALYHVEWDIADPMTGKTVEIGVPGEVRARGWSVMDSYHGDPEATAETITPDGWLRTGDLGVMDAEGYLIITGRTKEIIIRGGENIAPAEVEEALRRLESVAEAHVVGVADDHYGEICAAFVRLKPDATLTEDEMCAQLTGRIARFKIPAYLRIVEGFPLTASGKVQKFKLREQFTTAQADVVGLSHTRLTDKEDRMFEYFPGNYWWSLQLNSSLGMGGEMTELDRFVGPLRAIAGEHPVMGTAGDDKRAAWKSAWRECADHVEKLAQTDADRGLRMSAARKYLRAANYSFVSEVNTSYSDPEKPLVYADAQRRFRAALTLAHSPIELVKVPFEDTTLPALFIPAVGFDGLRPCMIHFDGSHDVKEVTYMRHREGLAQRGISLLVVDHPGSGEALRLQKLFARSDIEVAATACVDYLGGRPDVDPDAIGIIAQSMGGYYAPRSAAFEKRLKCCVVWGAVWDLYQVRQAGEKRTGVKLDPAEFYLLGEKTADGVWERLKEFSLENGIMEQVECALLVLHGENDRQVPLWAAERTYERAVNAASRELRVFTVEEGSGCEHCQVDVRSVATDFIHDWLAVFFEQESADETSGVMAAVEAL